MIPTPILTVLSTFRKNGVQTLLMGGQACVFYGAAQVSKDVDLALLAEPANIERLRVALNGLRRRAHRRAALRPCVVRPRPRNPFPLPRAGSRRVASGPDVETAPAR